MESRGLSVPLQHTAAVPFVWACPKMSCPGLFAVPHSKCQISHPAAVTSKMEGWGDTFKGTAVSQRVPFDFALQEEGVAAKNIREVTFM